MYTMHVHEHVPPSIEKEKKESFAQADFVMVVVKARATLDFPLRVVAIVGSM